jgi:CheY-like chemotaxis protein
MDQRLIFYCDDDEDDLMMFCDTMKEIDPSITCITFRESEKALLKLSETSFHPDMIFLDINMPKVNGIEMLAILKQTKALRDTPIIMYTTSTYVNEINQCIELGANQVLTKLFDPRDTMWQLRETVAAYLA